MLENPDEVRRHGVGCQPGGRGAIVAPKSNAVLASARTTSTDGSGNNSIKNESVSADGLAIEQMEAELKRLHNAGIRSYRLLQWHPFVLDAGISAPVGL